MMSAEENLKWQYGLYHQGSGLCQKHRRCGEDRHKELQFSSRKESKILAQCKWAVICDWEFLTETEKEKL